MKPWSVSSTVPGASLTTLLFAVVIVACVYIGREVLVPMTLAILMSFVLAPPVDFLQRCMFRELWPSLGSFCSPLPAYSAWAD
jgi:predicted PurR-regulated permease PerM